MMPETFFDCLHGNSLHNMQCLLLTEEESYLPSSSLERLSLRRSALNFLSAVHRKLFFVSPPSFSPHSQSCDPQLLHPWRRRNCIRRSLRFAGALSPSPSLSFLSSSSSLLPNPSLFFFPLLPQKRRWNWSLCSWILTRNRRLPFSICVQPCPGWGGRLLFRFCVLVPACFSCARPCFLSAQA